MANKAVKFVSSLIELFSREVKEDKRKDIFDNDIDNLYPNRVEVVERNSVTASAASGKLKSFITGRGFEDQMLNKRIVNISKNYNGYKFLSLLSESLKTHGGAFIHVNYNIEGEVNSLDVIPYKKCRIAKEDSKGYQGKIYVADWENQKTSVAFGASKPDNFFFYPFNRDKKVILDQRKQDAGEGASAESLVTKYRGQVYFLNLDDANVYPFAWLHPAYNDADSEFRVSLYRNSNLRTGFLGKTIIIANGLDAEDTDTFQESVKDWLGAENSSSVFVLQPEEIVEDPKNIVHTVELKSTYDSERFSNDEKAIANNIRKAYLCIPKILIDPEDSFFGSSGEAFKEAVRYYNNETHFIRERVAYSLEAIYGDGLNYTIKELGANDL